LCVVGSRRLRAVPDVWALPAWPDEPGSKYPLLSVVIRNMQETTHEATPPGLLHEPLCAIIHWLRVLGYLPWVVWSLLRWPLRTVAASATYSSLRTFSPTWRWAVRQMVAYGSSRAPRLIRAQTRPNRQYLLAAHPHGILNEGWWNLIARFGLGVVDGVQLVMCVAPFVKWYPLYYEIFGDRVTDASAATIRKILRETNLTPAIIPGGFSEAVYTNAHPEVEYNYIADRLGFVRLAIEFGVDIIPAYTFGINDMYSTPGFMRHQRAKKAQSTGVPMVAWWSSRGAMGPFGPNTPDTEELTIVTFDPFPASKYAPEQLVQAHADYLLYLEKCFESRKAEAGAGCKRIEFIGKTIPPKTARSRL
jgi:hypothetical protein